LNVPEIESDLGIEVYASRSVGIGGRIRFLPEDFKVEEILIDGSKASFQSDVSKVSGWGRHLLCVLVKKNWDTLIATKKVADLLGINSDRVHIAGIKDKKALTAQHISISGVPPEKISVIKIKNMMVNPVRFVDEKLSPHLLFGNRFQILIRALEHDKPKVEERIEKTRAELENVGGMPNFFGHQRFGTTRPITHLIGYYILRRDFGKAVFTYLSKVSGLERPDSREARQHLSETGDFESAVNYFPERLIYERLMLKHLAKYPRDFLGAFRRLPLRLRRLFVQAYQSFLFNRFLSERIKQGIPLSEPQVGDFAIDLDELGLPTGRYFMATVENLSTISKKLDERKARIAVPLIGFKQNVSQGIQGGIEQEILEKENMSPCDFRISEMPEVSSPGGLRSILTPILDLRSKEACEDSLSPNRLMVELGFTLHKSSYATILLREFMKPTSIVEAGF